MDIYYRSIRFTLSNMKIFYIFNAIKKTKIMLIKVKVLGISALRVITAALLMCDFTAKAYSHDLYMDFCIVDTVSSEGCIECYDDSAKNYFVVDTYTGCKYLHKTDFLYLFQCSYIIDYWKIFGDAEELYFTYPSYYKKEGPITYLHYYGNQPDCYLRILVSAKTFNRLVPIDGYTDRYPFDDNEAYYIIYEPIWTYIDETRTID